ncbi:retrotransposon protein, putative, ty3-gypsy subclass [Tanacetum coccineum]
MTTVDQGMSVEEIERVVAQRVANAIEAIAIYETKTNMARKSISQTEQQECKVAGNANNKRKWEGNHNGQCTIKGGNCKKVGHITQECRNPTAARNQRTHTCYKCGSLRHFKSKCLIVKFQKRVDKKISTLSERQAENKRKLNNTSKNNQNQQQPNKRQNTGKDYAAGHGEKKYYGGSKPLCPKCNYHHDGPCPPKCHRCNIVGHLVRNCRRPTNDNTTNNQRGTGTSQKVNCYECGNQGHYKRDCPERKNQSHKNQIGGTGAHGVVHTLRGRENLLKPPNNAIELGSFDALIRLWIGGKCLAVIVCAEEEDLCRIQWGNETLIIHDDGSNQGNATRFKYSFSALNRRVHCKEIASSFGHVTAKEVGRHVGEEATWDLGHLIDWRLPNDKGGYLRTERAVGRGFIDPVPTLGAPVLICKKKEGSFWICFKGRRVSTPNIEPKVLLGTIDDSLKGFINIAKPMTKAYQKKVKF